MAGELSDVVPGESVEAAWGNDIRDRVLSRYTDAIDRGNKNPIPASGDLSWLDDTLRVEVFDGSDWTTILSDVYLLRSGDEVVGDQTIGSVRIRNLIASTTEPVAPAIGLVWLDLS